MKKEIADKWAKALRSGDYKQGTDALKMNGCYCCLGVLCEISGLGSFNFLKSSPIEAQCYIIGIGLGGCKTFGELPEEVVKWAGLNSQIGVAKNKHEEDSLVYKNDKEKLSFTQIADYIDANCHNL